MQSSFSGVLNCQIYCLYYYNNPIYVLIGVSFFTYLVC